jgi:hypothetical protein
MSLINSTASAHGGSAGDISLVSVGNRAIKLQAAPIKITV